MNDGLIGRMLRSVPLLLALMLVPAPAAGEEPPRYLDEQKEEIFGPGYLPSSPGDAGMRQQAGRPAGFALPKQAQRWLDAMRPAAAMAELRERFPWAADRLAQLRARLAARPDMGVPLRRSIRELVMPARPTLTAARLPPAPVSGPLRQMTAHFVDVGQGAGAILEFPCGVAVIDTGGEYGSGVDGARRFTDYLDGFFAKRPQLDRTIDVLITSHPHKDHLSGLSRMFAGRPRYRVRNIVDNGQTHPKGSVGAQTRLRRAAIRAGARYSAVELKTQVAATGTTNAVIDPLHCRGGIDPVITAFWGGRNDALHGRAGRRYANPNNHSVVVRVDFGQASFLFLGDLQREAAEDMLAEYAESGSAFDVDVLHASHHGAENGTSDQMLKAVSPEIAVISMGGRAESGSSTAWGHGHPRLRTLRVMQERPHVVAGSRAPVEVWAATREEAPFVPVTVGRAIYGTGWDGTVLVTARSDGSYRVTGLLGPSPGGSRAGQAL